MAALALQVCDPYWFLRKFSTLCRQHAKVRIHLDFRDPPAVYLDTLSNQAVKAYTKKKKGSRSVFRASPVRNNPSLCRAWCP